MDQMPREKGLGLQVRANLFVKNHFSVLLGFLF